MKNYIIPTLFTIFLCLSSFTSTESVTPTDPQEPLFEYDQAIMAIIENKCMGCHNPEARNEKAREKLQWEKLPSMSKAEVVGKFDKIIEILDEGSMPPEKMLARFPDKALTKKETRMMKEWFEVMADELISE